MKNEFEKFDKDNPFFFDGAFGTYYFSKLENDVVNKNPKRAADLEKSCENGNIDYPELVEKIHHEYIDAGVNAIKSNTFGANSNNFPEKEKRNLIIKRGYEIAVKAVKVNKATRSISSVKSNKGTKTVKTYKETDVSVFADIGPIYFLGSKDIKNIKDIKDIDEMQSEYVEIVDEFLKAGATNFIFETMPEYTCIEPAIRNIKQKLPGSFIVVSFAVSQDGYSSKGHYYKNLISDALKNSLIDIAGLNCVCGPGHLLNLISGLDRLTGELVQPKLKTGGLGLTDELIQPNQNIKISDKLCAMPNSGYPETINGRTIYRDNKKYFSEKIAQIYKSGIFYLGGCCGTTPGHLKCAIDENNCLKQNNGISKVTQTPPDERYKTTTTYRNGNIKRKYENFKKDGIENSGITSIKTIGEKPEKDIKTVKKSEKFFTKLNLGEKVIAVELDPPGNADISFIMDAAMKVKNLGADLVTVADSPLARSRADSIIISAKIKREIGIDVLPHLSCRDRNIIGIRGALIGAVIEKIENVLIVTGDPVSGGDSNESKGVFSFNSNSLIAYVQELNRQIFTDNPLTICGALNINARNFKAELQRAAKKEASGVQVFFTQPVFSDLAVENIKEAHEKLKSKIMTGILPVAGYKNAMFLNNEVPGIHIPEEFISSIKDKNPEDAYELSINFSMDIIRKTYKFTYGYYIMTPMKRIDLVCEILKGVRLE